MNIQINYNKQAYALFFTIMSILDYIPKVLSPGFSNKSASFSYSVW